MLEEEIFIDGVTLVSSKRASQMSDYNQDYIGQLARNGQIKAKRVGGLWYVSMDSLNSYKTQPLEEKVDKINFGDQHQDAEVLVSFDGKDYISARRASEITGYNQDYVGQLARSGKILSRQVGNRWYVDRQGIVDHKQEKDNLLAGVQVSSVGLRREVPENKLEDPAEVKIHSGLLNYKSEEDSHLLPAIPKKEYSIPIREYTMPIYSPVTDLRRKSISINRPKSLSEKKIPSISDRVKPQIPTSNNPHQVRSTINNAPKRKRNLNNLVFGGVLIVAATFSFITIRSILMNQFNINLHKDLTASAIESNAGLLAQELGDKLENEIVPEVSYQRN